jgi:hypothetical protein
VCVTDWLNPVAKTIVVNIAKYLAFIVRSFVVLSTALSGKVKDHPLHGDSQSLIPAKLVMGLSY